MNIQEINFKLQSYKNDFYNRKEIELLNNTDNGEILNFLRDKR